MKHIPLIITAGLVLVVQAQQNDITLVSPDHAEAGTNGLVVTFTLDSDLPPPPPAGEIPTAVMIGSLEGSLVTHDDQYLVEAVFDIPEDEESGAKDCTVIFSTPNGEISFIVAGGFLVTGGTPPVIGGIVSNRQPAAA